MSQRNYGNLEKRQIDREPFWRNQRERNLIRLRLDECTEGLARMRKNSEMMDGWMDLRELSRPRTRRDACADRSRQQ
jgi:hypothetical protein